HSASSHDRFIVKYREVSAERADVAKAKAGLSRAATAANGTRVQHLHRMALGADVVKSDRKLDRVQAESLMRQIASDPNVEYVEVDRLNKPLLTPNDHNLSRHFGLGTGAVWS